jgi:hypothetical protein
MNKVEAKLIRKNYIAKAKQLKDEVKNMKRKIDDSIGDLHEPLNNSSVSYHSEIWLQDPNQLLEFSDYCNTFRNHLNKIHQAINELEKTLKIKNEA